jgi:hypothetical protein
MPPDWCAAGIAGLIKINRQILYLELPFERRPGNHSMALARRSKALVVFGFSPVLLFILPVMSGSDGVVRESPKRGGPAQKVQASPMQWRVLGGPGSNSVRIGGDVGWCPESGVAALPRISGVRQVDHPRSIVLTAFLANRVIRPCAGVEFRVERHVRIRGGIRGRAILDGSQQPPAKRWPRGGR